MRRVGEAALDTVRLVDHLALDTASGVRIDLNAPRPQDIRLGDVAAALSKICRFAAQATSFYSVAQHAVLVASLVEGEGHPHLALAALQHDSHEAYVGDLPTPLKRRLDAESGGYYGRLCQSLDAAIEKAFGIDGVHDDPVAIGIIKAADKQALFMEARILLHDGGEGIRGDRQRTRDAVMAIGQLSDLLAPPQAERQFLATHTRSCQRSGAAAT